MKKTSNTFTVYTILHEANPEFIYIGYTSNTIEKRFNQHKLASTNKKYIKRKFYKYVQPFYTSIKKDNWNYFINNFKIQT